MCTEELGNSACRWLHTKPRYTLLKGHSPQALLETIWRKRYLGLLFAGFLLVWIKTSTVELRIFMGTGKLVDKPMPTKYILLWTPATYAPFPLLGKGFQAFIKNNCSATNCHVTSNRNFFGGNLTKFDAIAFNGRNIDTRRSKLPQQRSVHQKYIFFDMESSDNYPVCDPVLDGFFNMTATYKLDSDIVLPYILVRSVDGAVLGPKVDMNWLDVPTGLNEEAASIMRTKSKAAAWFVSNCLTRSDREAYASSLKRALAKYNKTVDIYGGCGDKSCKRFKNKSLCENMLKRDYFFYLSFENSLNEDYVTEKVTTALRNYNVPIVYGGANYSRFLPPGSYINAREHSPKELASIINELMQNPAAYNNFFKWRNHYTYSEPEYIENVCSVCAALSDTAKMESTKVYHDFRRWWNPKYTQRCKRRVKRKKKV